MTMYRALCIMFVIMAIIALKIERVDLMIFAFSWAILVMLAEISERVKGTNG